MQKYFRNEILEAHLYHVEDVPGIKLSQNECPWDVPIDLKVKITERLIKTDWNRYPLTDLIDLQKKLAKYYKVEHDQIVLSNGSNTIIQALIHVIEPRSKVLVLDPCFVVYEMQAKLNGNRVIKVPLSDEFELLTEKTIATITKEKPGIVFIANPNAPTGTLFDKRSLYRIIQAASCPVVIDEAYYPFTEETVIEWLADFDNLMVMRTFSKAMALAGVRFGLMITNSAMAQQVEKFLMSFRLSKITSVIIDEVLDNMEYMQAYVKDIVKERGRLFSAMQKIEKIRVYPSEANFLLFKVRKADDVFQKLLEEKVVLRNVGDGAKLKNCLRVGVGTPEENDKFLENLKKIVS